MWGDMGYQGKDLKDHIKREYDIEIEIVKRPPSRFWVHKDTPPELLPKVEPGFKVQPRRWWDFRIVFCLKHFGIQNLPFVISQYDSARKIWICSSY
ncbi:transposase [Trichonephila clavata]|uniref:Transposase n=1 Tax=Trichonephila clavata TaxID=2740835 RepID=A0A8X6J2L2_TRICU|nr:transposase [Trichonephila clavata]GFR23710.1 transposase [Trichonephila clavata]